jgi:hypothetical protein
MFSQVHLTRIVRRKLLLKLLHAHLVNVAYLLGFGHCISPLQPLEGR